MRWRLQNACHERRSSCLSMLACRAGSTGWGAFTMTQTYSVGYRSRFVTSIAWVFIVLGLVASVSALVRHAGLAAFPERIARGGAPLPQPLLTGWLLAGLPQALAAGGGMSGAVLAAAVG